MAKSLDLINYGMAVDTARRAGLNDKNIALTATGSTIADALPISADLNVFTTVAASTGAILPKADTRGIIVIRNAGANTLTVYPNALESINNGTVGAGITITANNTRRFFPAVNGWIVI